MHRFTAALFLLFITFTATAREQGYALECNSGGSPQTHIVSFLEEDIDKKVSLSANLWDIHTWTKEELLVESFLLRQGQNQPQLVTSIRINRETLRAVLSETRETLVVTELQCQTWSPRTRNK